MTGFTLKTLTEEKNQETGEITSKMAVGQMVKDAISEAVKEKYELTEEEKKAMDSRIEWKLKTGKKLTAKEMEYLKYYHPDLYRVAGRIEQKRKTLRNQLKHAKSKEEVQKTISVAFAGAERDPDKEYIMAMIQKEAGDFMKSAAYARLPQSLEEGKKKKTSDSTRYFAAKEKEEQETWQADGKTMFGIFLQMQWQCEQISVLTEEWEYGL